ncbi:MAG: ParB/RepB/Spo0J family partition protein [Geminicoccaceae bacterium]|nr:ParB/RepB/Spo0J family partition protein [Geminicoccaceae bacterium]MDW8123320.1 ParB/RepB/Spo0J family partition protein [Geminicoccaceae bacterium]
MSEDDRAPRRRSLGMGLAALLGGDPALLDPAAGGRPAQWVPIEFLRPSPLQPRRQFPEAELEELARSIRDKGLLQPLLVRPAPAGAPGYEIVAGERRWRAAQRAGLHELPVLVRELADREVLELALVENLQRADLGPLEEARAYRRLIEEFGHDQEEVARVVGRSRSHVANTLRLLSLPEEVARLLEEGKLTAGHARALLGAEDPVALALEVVRRELSVRETEALVRARARRRDKSAGGRQRDPDLVALERRLATRLGLPIAIRPKARGGSLTIRYSSLEQLEAVIRRLVPD